MNVRKLISELQKYNGNLEVIIDGYEGGFETIGSFEIIKVKEYEPKERRWFYGVYRDDEEGFQVLHLVDKEHPEGWDL